MKKQKKNINFCPQKALEQQSKFVGFTLSHIKVAADFCERRINLFKSL